MNPTTKKPDGQFHSLERLFAYKKVRDLEKKNAQPDGTWTNSSEYDKALLLARRYSFVTGITSLVVEASNPFLLSLNDNPYTTNHDKPAQYEGHGSSADSLPNSSDENANLTTCSPGSSNLTLTARDGETVEFSEAVSSLEEYNFEDRMTTLTVTGDECSAWVIYRGVNHTSLWKRFTPGVYISFRQIGFLYRSAKSLKCVVLNDDICL